MTHPPLKPLLEALIFASDSPLAFKDIRRILAEETQQETGEGGAPADKEIKTTLETLVEEYRTNEGCGLTLAEVAGGYQFRSRSEHAPYVRRLYKEKPHRLSRSALETLSIVAYRQPVTRAEIDDIRGVDSSAAMKTLLERGLLRIVGYSEDPGRPGLYGTTSLFLEVFNLNGLADLPPLETAETLSETLQAPLDGVESPAGYAAAETADVLGAAERKLLQLAEETDIDVELIDALEIEMQKVGEVHTRVTSDVFPAAQTPSLPRETMPQKSLPHDDGPVA